MDAIRELHEVGTAMALRIEDVEAQIEELGEQNAKQA
jgi:hypothetical protein